MRYKCILEFDNKKINAYLEVREGRILFLKRRIISGPEPMISLPLYLIKDIKIYWRIYYVRIDIIYSYGIYLKKLSVRGDKKLASLFKMLKISLRG